MVWSPEFQDMTEEKGGRRSDGRVKGRVERAMTGSVIVSKEAGGI